MKKMNSKSTLRGTLMTLCCVFAFLFANLSTVHAQFINGPDAIDVLTTEILSLQADYDVAPNGSALQVDLNRKIRFYRNIAKDLHKGEDVANAVSTNFSNIPAVVGRVSLQAGGQIPHTSASYAKNMLTSVEALLQ